MDVAQPSLDQLRIFLAVVEEGSFNRAASKLGRAISVISYGIANLEAQLGVTLFDREGSRRPQLTEAGKALLSEVRTVADDVDLLLAKVRSLHQGLEAELALAVDVMVPSAVLAQVLRSFQQMFPTVTLRLNVEGLGSIVALVLDNRATLGIAGPDVGSQRELERQRIGEVEMVPVAAPSHPLATAGKLIPGMVRNHLQLVLTDRSPLTAGQDFGVFSPRSWRLADLSSKHLLLREGIGWGSMPRHMIADDLAQERLVELSIPEQPTIAYTLNAIWRRDTRLGPAANWALDAFVEQLGSV